jgi:DNA polymerase
MDARERLRRYLEQRRELGESELVLDAMPVDDVMRMLGARPRVRTAASAVDRAHEPAVERNVDSARAPSTSVPDVAPPAPVRPADPPRRVPEQPVTSDWRAALSNAEKSAPPPVTAKATQPAVTAKAATPPVTAKATPLVGAPTWLASIGVPMGLQAGPDSLRAHATRLDALIAELPSLEAIATAVAGCTRCPLYASAKNPVPGEGNPHADFVCVGEAPGQNEDEQGRPFVGAAGQLLTKILGAIKLSREDVFICNVLKHRPPGNRDPLPNEVHACTPYLLRQLDLIQPKVILALGSFAARTLLGTEEAIGRLRGKIHMYHGIPVIATYHPAALLRNEAWKRPAWEDVQLARRIYDAARAALPASPE